MKVKVFVSLALLCLLVSVSVIFPHVVFGSGVGNDDYGWSESSNTAWVANESYEAGYYVIGDLCPAWDVLNFTGYRLKADYSYLTAVRGAWWWFWCEKVTEWTLWFDTFDSVENVSVHVKVYENSWDFGALVTDHIEATVRNNDTFDGNYYFNETLVRSLGWTQVVKDSSDLYDVVGGYFEVLLRKVSGTCVCVSVLNKDVSSPCLTALVSVNVTVSPEFFVRCGVHGSLAHRGYGRVSCFLAEKVYTQNEDVLPDDVDSADWGHEATIGMFDLFARLFGAVGSVLPSWLTDMLGSFSGWFGWLLPVVTAVMGVVGGFLPVLPFLLLFYVVDALVTSAKEGSFVPVGRVVSELYGLVAGVVGAVIGAAEAIWSFIKFW